MIFKDLTRKKTGTGQLIKYIFRYILKKEKVQSGKQAKTPFIIRHNIRSKTIEGFVAEFKTNEKNRLYKRKDQSIIHHSILSWSHKDTDHITDRMLRKMAKEFIRLRGENNLFVGTKHTDRQHTHLHMAVSGSQINGRSSRMSKKAFSELKLSLDAYQREHYPELSNSLPMHGRSKMKKSLEAKRNPKEVKTKENVDKEFLSLQKIREKKRAMELMKETDVLERVPVSPGEMNVPSDIEITGWPGLTDKRISTNKLVSPG